MGKIANLGLACLLGIGLTGPVPAAAQDLIDGKEPELILTILKAFGTAHLETDYWDDPMISGRTDGKEYKLFFYGCTDNEGCGSVTFWAYWEGDFTLERVNEWNKETRFGKLYIDDDEDLVLEFDVNLQFGVHERTMEDNAELWTDLMSRVQKEVVSP